MKEKVYMSHKTIIAILVVGLVVAAPFSRGYVIRSSVASKLRSVPRFPHNLLHSVSGSEVSILAVAHQRREPRYWTERLGLVTEGGEP